MDPEVLKEAPLFAGLEDDAASALAAAMGTIKLNRGEVLFHEGDKEDRLYVVVSGKIKLGRSGSAGRENLLGVLGPGQMFGELSLFDPGPRSSTATAVTACEIRTLEHEELMARVEGGGGLVGKLLPLLAPLALSWLAKRVGGARQQADVVNEQADAQQGGVLGGGLGDILGNVLGGGQGAGGQGGGLGDILGNVLGGGAKSGGQGGGGVMDVLGGLLGGGQQAPQPQHQSGGGVFGGGPVISGLPPQSNQAQQNTQQGGAGGIVGTLNNVLDRDGDGNALNDLIGMFGGRR